MRVSPQQTINYGVTADNPAFDEAMRAMEATVQAAGATSVTGTVVADPAATTGTGITSFTIDGTTVTSASDSLNDIATGINASGIAGVTASVVSTAGGYALKISSGNTNDLTFGGSLTPLGINDTTYNQSLQTALQSALTVSNSAVKDLSNLQESVAATSSQLTSAQQQQTTYVTYLQNSLSGVKDVDTGQVAAKVSQYQTQLQASYLAVAQISKISLAQYL